MAKMVYNPKEFISLDTPTALDDLILDTPYKINTPENKCISDVGKGLVADILLAFRPELSEYRMSFMINQIGTEWITTTKDVYGGRGTFPKRIAHAMKKILEVKLPSKTISLIGNIFNENSVRQDA